ncbi:hypothetical protein F5Y01DRAFT_324533 [Xylaria sp. FL0043]|nr:hypothetical protein F5Y01DRAFT_324533 [Xylaria sp. FL0043]
MSGPTTDPQGLNGQPSVPGTVSSPLCTLLVDHLTDYKSTQATAGEPSQMVEVRQTSSMGKGLFATRHIPLGTRIQADLPLVRISNLHPFSRDVAVICNALRYLSKAEFEELDQLDYDEGYDTEVNCRKIREWYKEQAFTTPSQFPLKGKALREYAKITVKRCAIFIANRVALGVTVQHGMGVFRLTSRVNHSCVPNTFKWYNWDLGQLTLHAMRDIQPGEELTADYVRGTLITKQERADRLSNWDFTCTCRGCTDPDLESTRRRAIWLSERVNRFSKWRNGEVVDMGLPMPRGNAGARQEVGELILLLKGLGLEGWELIRALQADAFFHLDAYDHEMATHYAERAAELERIIIGDETELLYDLEQGAWALVQHVKGVIKARFEQWMEYQGEE